MLTVVAIVLLCTLLGFVVILAMPVELLFAIQNDDTQRNELALAWAGVFKVPLGRSAKKPAKKPPKEGKKTTDRKGTGKFLRLMRNGDVRRRFLRYIRRLIRSIKIRKLDLHIRLGLDDPADTGRLWGVLGPLNSLVAGIRQANIHIEPEFADEVFLLASHGRIRVIPLQIIWLCLFFFMSPTVIRAIALKS